MRLGPWVVAKMKSSKDCSWVVDLQSTFIPTLLWDFG